MLNFLKKIPWKKIEFKTKLRSTDELFFSGKIFDATDRELNSILKELTVGDSSYETLQNRSIIRAITVLSIKNNKYRDLIEFFFIILTIFSLILAWKQYQLSKLTSIPILIEQNTIMRRAVEFCKQNPGAPESGLSYTDGKPAPCEKIMESSQIKELIE